MGEVSMEKDKDAEMEKSYIAIDLKSFYASVECVERGLNPMTANLVVADESRTEKTICLAVSPALKKYGIPGRARLFEVIQRCREIKAATGENITYTVAVPRMQLYMDYSCRIYKIYTEFISPEDIHVYSIDEVFMDVSRYRLLYRDEKGEPLSARALAKKMIKRVYEETGITATAGIGTNLYLAKIAMDIMAKRVDADEDGVRIAQLDEQSYREQLWHHRPLTDFWRIGNGICQKLEKYGMYTMGDIARMSVSKWMYGTGEDLLYKLFGVDAELLIDHAWGYEPCEMADIKSYKPADSSISSGQVLSCGYDYGKSRLVVREMVGLQVLDLIEKKLVTDSVTLDVGYDRESDTSEYTGDMVLDFYGRIVPKPAHGSCKFSAYTSSTEEITRAVMEIFDRIVNPSLLVKRLTLTFGSVLPAGDARACVYEQMNLFTDYEAREQEASEKERERRMQEMMLKIQDRYGKNSILKGTNLEEGATTIERNKQIGGHRA